MIRKNKKFIDPRYFMNEKMESLAEEQTVKGAKNAEQAIHMVLDKRFGETINNDKGYGVGLGIFSGTALAIPTSQEGEFHVAWTVADEFQDVQPPSGGSTGASVTKATLQDLQYTQREQVQGGSSTIDALKSDAEGRKGALWASWRNNFNPRTGRYAGLVVDIDSDQNIARS